MPNTSLAAPAGALSTPAERPTRMELLAPMLEGTQRGGVPIRRAFLQTIKPDINGNRAGALSHLMRDQAALDTYLLITALASSSEPYETWFPSSTWAQVARLDKFAEVSAARARWAKVATKLTRERLIVRRRSGNKMNYVLLHESGNGEPYTRPTQASHGTWFSVPHVYWNEEFDERLSLPEKAMLLIALDQPDNFRLPADRAPAWYGISESTARRGLHGLEKAGILTAESKQIVDPKSPSGWKTVLRYTTVGPWSIPNRKIAMTTYRRRRKVVAALRDEGGDA
jgi:hypothetical protein